MAQIPGAGRLRPAVPRERGAIRIVELWIARSAQTGRHRRGRGTKASPRRGRQAARSSAGILGVLQEARRPGWLGAGLFTSRLKLAAGFSTCSSHIAHSAIARDGGLSCAAIAIAAVVQGLSPGRAGEKLKKGGNEARTRGRQQPCSQRFEGAFGALRTRNTGQKPDRQAFLRSK